MPTASSVHSISQSLSKHKADYVVLALLVLLTAIAPIAEPVLVAFPESKSRLFIHLILESLCAILAILSFLVGWQTFKTDRNWSMTLLHILFFAVGLFCAGHLIAYLSLYLSTSAISMQMQRSLVIYSLSARFFSAAALFLTAGLSNTRNISVYTRIGLLATVIAISATIIALFTYYPALTAGIFADAASLQTRPSIIFGLTCLDIATVIAFIYRLRQSDSTWLHLLMLASVMLLLIEIDYALIVVSRHAYPLLGKATQAIAFFYVYRATFLYAIQWPIEQINDWKERLKTSQRELSITKLAVDNSGYYIFEFSKSETIVYASDNACRRLGYRSEELVGFPLWKIAAQSRSEILKHDWSPLQQLQHNATVQYESFLLTKNGESFPVTSTTTCIVDDGAPHIYAVMEDITERKRFETQIAENALYLRQLLDSIPTVVVITTPDGTCIDTNRAAEKNTTRQKDSLRGKSLLQSFKGVLVQESSEQALTDAFAQARAGHATSLDLQMKILGEERYLDFCVAPVRDDTGNIINLVTTATDITDRVHAQNELKLASTVFDHSAEAFLITDGQMHTLSINKAFTTITGFEQDEVIGTVPPLFVSGKHLVNMNTSLQESGDWSGEVEWICKDGHLGYEWVTVTKVRDDERGVGNYIVIFSDISEKKRVEEHVQYLAYYDPLTNLPNRVLLEDRIKQAIAAAKRDAHKVAVMFLDLDHFKTINDSLGHHRGDKLLAEVARRLTRCVREADTVARLGGDEFVIALPGLEQAEEAAAVAHKLLAELQIPYQVSGTELRLTVSIGVSIYPDDGDDFSRLIMSADAAMYHAKENGRNNAQFFIGEMNRRAAELLDMETRLRRAIERNEFLLHYQPQLDLQSGDIVGFEALVRWLDPEHGLIPPNEFIPIAEERGLITQIGNFVLRTACQQNRAWQIASLPKLRIAVNISAKQFRDKHFVDNVRAVLAETGLEARYLELEVTETTVMQDAENLISTLTELRQLGVHLAIDDFGTGYSSLSYLKRFPIDKIKIDRSFIRDIPDDKDDYSIVQAIIGLSRQLNLLVVAEGVETQEQLAALRESNCDQYQGFYFSRPLAAVDAELLLRDKNSAG